MSCSLSDNKCVNYGNPNPFGWLGVPQILWKATGSNKFPQPNSSEWGRLLIPVSMMVASHYIGTDGWADAGTRFLSLACPVGGTVSSHGVQYADGAKTANCGRPSWLLPYGYCPTWSLVPATGGDLTSSLKTSVYLVPTLSALARMKRNEAPFIKYTDASNEFYIAVRHGCAHVLGKNDGCYCDKEWSAIGPVVTSIPNAANATMYSVKCLDNPSPQACQAAGCQALRFRRIKDSVCRQYKDAVWHAIGQPVFLEAVGSGGYLGSDRDGFVCLLQGNVKVKNGGRPRCCPAQAGCSDTALPSPSAGKNAVVWYTLPSFWGGNATGAWRCFPFDSYSMAFNDAPPDPHLWQTIMTLLENANACWDASTTLFATPPPLCRTVGGLGRHRTAALALLLVSAGLFLAASVIQRGSLV